MKNNYILDPKMLQIKFEEVKILKIKAIVIKLALHNHA